jgi:DNA-binding protein H-NS
MKETEKTLHEQLNKKRNVYVGQKMELEMKIAEIESQLSTIGKRKKDVNADGPGKNTTISHD